MKLVFGTKYVRILMMSTCPTVMLNHVHFLTQPTSMETGQTNRQASQPHFEMLQMNGWLQLPQVSTCSLSLLPDLRCPSSTAPAPSGFRCILAVDP